MIRDFLWGIFAQYNATDVDLPRVDNPDSTLTNVFNVVLALGGAVAVAYIVFGGIKFSMSQGDPTKTKEAREAILYAVIGLIVVIISFTLINFVIGKF